MKKTILGEIIKHDGYKKPHYGFKITFKTIKEAQYYKDMIDIILQSDDYKIENKHGYHDREN